MKKKQSKGVNFWVQKLMDNTIYLGQSLLFKVLVTAYN